MTDSAFVLLCRPTIGRETGRPAREVKIAAASGTPLRLPAWLAISSTYQALSLSSISLMTVPSVSASKANFAPAAE